MFTENIALVLAIKLMGSPFGSYKNKLVIFSSDVLIHKPRDNVRFPTEFFLLETQFTQPYLHGFKKVHYVMGNQWLF